jgi:hypothetical protein
MATISWQQIQNRFINQAQSSTTELDKLFSKIKNQQSFCCSNQVSLSS